MSRRPGAVALFGAVGRWAPSPDVIVSIVSESFPKPGHGGHHFFGPVGSKTARIHYVSKLLERAVAEASKLPESEQDAFGAWILAELESEHRWDKLFAQSPDLLSALAAEAIREDEAGETEPLDPKRL